MLLVALRHFSGCKFSSASDAEGSTACTCIAAQAELMSSGWRAQQGSAIRLDYLILAPECLILTNQSRNVRLCQRASMLSIAHNLTRQIAMLMSNPHVYNIVVVFCSAAAGLLGSHSVLFRHDVATVTSLSDCRRSGEVLKV